MNRINYPLSACLVFVGLLGIGGPYTVPVPDSTAVTLKIADAEQGYSLDVPFVPTSDEIMAEMFRMAAVTKDDLVYDLGSGDGRMVVTAAKQYGAKAVGVDLNPERIRESRENAAKAGVTDKVTFIQGNLFDADISQATVMMLYLLPGVNLKLRPKLLKELKPGTRIVSHDFNMGDWKPDATSKVRGGGTVYYWVVPANLSGTWVWNLPGKGSGKETERYTGRFVQRFQEASGQASVADTKLPMNKTSINGDRIRFTVEREIDGKKIPILFDGRANGDMIVGKAYPGGHKADRAVSWRATREAMTIAQIEE